MNPYRTPSYCSPEVVEEPKLAPQDQTYEFVKVRKLRVMSPLSGHYIGKIGWVIFSSEDGVYYVNFEEMAPAFFFADEVARVECVKST